mgnify:CR=1 FL=1|jgi:hypothetical protein
MIGICQYVKNAGQAFFTSVAFEDGFFFYWNFDLKWQGSGVELF